MKTFGMFSNYARDLIKIIFRNIHVCKAPESERQHLKRLKIFFDFGLNLSLTLEQQAQIFHEKLQKNINWTYNSFRKFINIKK
jgi:hypothetical protein